MVIASWKKETASLFNADANIVANEILSIGESATAEQIVEKATDEKTELHKLFTWDNDEAAHKWRVHQARNIVCNLVIREEERKPNRPELRMFHKADKSSGYIPATTVFRNEDMYLQLLNNALAELRAFRRKYSFLSERQEIVDLINSLEIQLEKESA